jgi:hypothetical protein
MCALVASIATPHFLRHGFRQVGLLAFAGLSALGCAKGIEIVEGEDVILISLPDAGRRDAGPQLLPDESAGSGGAGSELENSPSDASSSTASNSGGSAGMSSGTAVTPSGDAGASDAGQ